MHMHLLWADDLVLNALDPESLQNLLNQLHHFCTLWGLSINPNKTKVMIFNKTWRVIKSRDALKLGNIYLHHYKTYCYHAIHFYLCGSFVVAIDELRKKAPQSICFSQK